MWEIDVPFDPDRLFADDGDTYLEHAFHEAHEKIFGYADRDTHIEAIAWRVAVSRPVNSKTEQRLANIDGAPGGAMREAYFSDGGWTQTPVYSFAGLEAERQYQGPALIESPFTSVVIDPGAVFRRTGLGNLIISPANTVKKEA